MYASLDLHCHIVPGVDDGATGWDECGRMLEEAAAALPRPALLAATPHIRLGELARPSPFRERRTDEFFRFAEARIPSGLRLASCGEVLLDRLPTARLASRMPSFPGTGWVLVELPWRLPWLLARLRLWVLSRFRDRILLAHPERYSWCVSRPGRIAELADLGVRAQVTARSFRADWPGSADTAAKLIRGGLCSVFSSDMHHPGDRMISAFDDLLGASRDALIRDGPASLLEDRMLPEPRS